MNLPQLVGVVLGAAILLAAIFAPKLADHASAGAREQAARAERMLSNYSPKLPRVEQLASPSALKDAKLEGAPAALQKYLEASKAAGQRTFNERAQSIEDGAKEVGLPSPGVTVPGANDSGIKASVAKYIAATKENETILQNSLKEAADASSLAANLEKDYTVGHQVLGMAELAKANDILRDAENLRTRQRALQTNLVESALYWKGAQGSADRYKSADMGPVLGGLRTDLADINARRDKATQERDSLKAQVDERQKQVDALRASLTAARQDMLALEQKSFIAGDDASFNAYRDAYTALSAKMNKMQLDEQVLTLGGRRGAELIGDNLATAELAGGELVIGLETLQSRLAIMEDTVARYSSGQTTLERAAEFVNQAGESTKKEYQRFVGEMSTLQDAQKAITTEALNAAAEAFKLESLAIKSAQNAAAAFTKSQQMAEKYVQAARTERGELDPTNQNARLAMIIDDQMLLQIGQTAEADAHVLIARIHLQVALNTEALLNDFKMLATLNTETQFDAAPFETSLATARSSAEAELDKAGKLYEDKIAKSVPSKLPVAKAAGLIGAAAVYHLRAILDPSTADANMQKARDLVASAFKGNEKNPYIQQFYATYRDYLGVAVAAPAPAPADPEKKPEGEKSGG